MESATRLAATVSAPAERQAMIEGAVAGIGGVVTETLNVPVLLAATLRSIVRIGHCYGYPLDSEIDRVFVLGILELSTADDPARRQASCSGSSATWAGAGRSTVGRKPSGPRRAWSRPCSRTWPSARCPSWATSPRS